MTDRVIAISSEVVECGKRVSDSKKKFVWRFRIGDTTYDLMLVSSALSGKRAITLNDQPIYSQQNVLNLKFDFNHNIAGHSLRIFRESEGVHNYDLRIDNRSFQYLLKKKDNPTTENKVANKYEAASFDPFSEFQKIASSGTPVVDNGSGFGDFDDFSNVEWAKQEKKPSQNEKKVEQPKKDLFDFDFEKKPSGSGINMQTFETTNNIGNLERNLNNIDLMNSDNFTTNNYSNYSNYLELIDMKAQKSQNFGQVIDPKQQSFLDKIKPDITGKQIINKTLMTAVEVKKKATNAIDSLI